jgi:hypothetical protein
MLDCWFETVCAKAVTRLTGVISRVEVLTAQTLRSAFLGSCIISRAWVTSQTLVLQFPSAGETTGVALPTSVVGLSITPSRVALYLAELGSANESKARIATETRVLSTPVTSQAIRVAVLASLHSSRRVLPVFPSSALQFTVFLAQNIIVTSRVARRARVIVLSLIARLAVLVTVETEVVIKVDCVFASIIV